ncbi:alcohol dehydrogenase catalytic domain-containing protein [Sphingosinicella sp. LHD-64]|uniref:alcohol dehydrogenase catalytic domain-containing protein n=1 Tax=Sphingosinicella sp. LHD-64 TaxID=3072139 RepID=UPI00280D8B66|nr:alcohol dehydrogenase catalytic domain-containing protein [Sphingosinicella sp. LHD-64]MDQ8756793.1 alcohol dehydrogenase catalytic domain-containing protein [Sphingosinicella sp. LHD-64]
MTAAPVSGLAALSDGRGGFVLDEIEVGPPGPGEVRVRIAAAGLCHTDHASLGWPGPLVLGHEGAGHVEAVGEGVVHLTPGQPVLLNWAIPCGACPQCAEGAAALCDRTHETDPSRYGTSRAHNGATRWRGESVARSFHLGTFSQHTVVRAEAVTPLPDGLLPERACILGCAVMTGVGSVLNVAQVKPGETVAVIGCGGVGLNVIQGARLAGAGRIVAIDRRTEALEHARAFGATDVVVARESDADHEQVIAAMRALTGGRGADHAFEATGVAALAFLPLRLARNGGNALQVSGAHGEVAVAMPDFFWNKRYMAPLYGACVPERDFPRLFRWAADGQLQIDALITREYPLEELARAMDDMLAGRTAKSVIRIG